MNNLNVLMDSYEPKLTIDQFKDLHKDFITPLDICIPVNQFDEEIKQYHKYFRQWGPYHTNFPRYGLPLVNLSGNIDDEVDPSCMPLDVWCQLNPTEMYWELDFDQPTEVMNLPSLAPLQTIQQCMRRSNILWWNNTGHFKPHVDMVPEAITHLRLWGINKTSKDYYLKYGNQRITDIEPGRLYLIDTLSQHEAFAVSNYVYTFFIAVTLDAIESII